VSVAKKTDKALKSLQKDVSKLQKQNDRLTKALEETREEQAETRREIQVLLEDRLTAQDATLTEPVAEAGKDEEKPEVSEVTEAAERRAKDLGVNLSTVEGTGSGGRVLVKDVETASDGAQ